MKHTSTTPGFRARFATCWQLVLGCLIVLVLAAGNAVAQTGATIESSQSGEYTDTLTWSGNIVPVIGGSLGTAQVDIQNDTAVTHSAGTAGANDRIRIGHVTNDAGSPGGTGTFTIQGGTFIAAGNLGSATTVGTNGGLTGSGTLNVTSGLGSFNSQSFLIAPNNANNLGVVNVSGTGTLDQDGGDFVVGDVGSGILNVTGGLVDVAKSSIGNTGGPVTNLDFEVGEGPTAVGSVNISGGLVRTSSGTGNGEVNIGMDGGDGTLVISGGTFSQNADGVGLSSMTGSINDGANLLVGRNSGGGHGSLGVLEISGTGVVNGSNDVVIGLGTGSTGVLNMTGGVLNADGDVFIGQNANAAGGSLGILNFSGGDLNVGVDGFNTGASNSGANLFIGNQGTGLANITAGSLLVERLIIVGQGTGNGQGAGSVNQSGGLVRTITANQSVIIGNSGFGEYTITGGTLGADGGGDIIIGNRNSTNNSAGTGILTINGADAVVDVSADSNNGGANFQIANSFDNNNPSDASEGTMNLMQGLATGGNMLLAQRGLGFYNQTGGTLDLQNSFVVGDSGSNTLASVTIVAGSGFANITGGLVDVDDALVLGDGNQGGTGGIEYQDSRDAVGSLNIGGTALFLTNTQSAEVTGDNNESSTEIGFNGTGFLTVSGGTFLSNHAGALGTNGGDGNATNTNANPAIGMGINDGADVRLGVSNSYNGDGAALRTNSTPNSPGDAPFGQIEVSGGAFLAARDINAGVGSFATGNIIVSGGSLRVDGDIRLGDMNDSVSTMTVSGGIVDVGYASAEVFAEGGGVTGQDGLNLLVADGRRTSALLSISGGSVNARGTLNVGAQVGAMGTVDVSGDGHLIVGEGANGAGGAVNGDLNLGSNTQGYGEMNVSGGTVTVRADSNRDLAIGLAGTGLYNQSGGIVDTEETRIGVNNSSTGTANISGGTLMTDNLLVIGNNGTNAVMNVSSTGKVIVDTDLIVGNGNGAGGAGQGGGSFGTLNISSGGVVNVGEEGINGAGSGNSEIVVGSALHAKGWINVSGGSLVSLDVNRSALIGSSGTGFLDVSGDGVVSVQGGLNLGQNAGSFGSVTMTGGLINMADPVALDNGGTRNQGDDINIGVQANNPGGAESAEGFFNVTGGTVEVDSLFNGQASADDNTNRRIRVGLRAGAIGSMHVGGTAFVHANELNVGEGSGESNQNDAGRVLGPAIGVYTQTGGSAEFDGTNTNQNTANGIAVIIGREDDSSGTINVEGGHLVLNGDLLVADAGIVTLHTAGNNTRFATVFGASEGFFNQSGGTVDVGNGTGGNDDILFGRAGNAEANLSGGVLNVDSDFILGVAADTIGTDGNGAGTGQGIVNVSGTADVNVSQDINLANADGNLADNQLNITGGEVEVGDELNIANGNNRNGNVNLSGGLLQVVDRLRIGGGNNTSTGSFNMSGGTLELGSAGGGTGILHVDADGGATTTGDVLGDVTGGVIRPRTAGGDINLLTSAVKDLNLAGGTLDMRGGDLLDTGTTSGTTEGGGVNNNDVNLSGGALVNTSNVAADVGFDTLGTAVWDMSNDGTQRLTTLVNTGNTVLRDVTAGGTSAGQINFDIFAPGDVSTLTAPVGGSLTTIVDTIFDGDNDALLGDDIDLSGTGITIKIDADSHAGSLAGATVGMHWDFVDWANFTSGPAGGSFAASAFNLDLSMATLPAGLFWNTTQWDTEGVLFIIPEPSRVLLTVLGLAGILLRRRRN